MNDLKKKDGNKSGGRVYKVFKKANKDISKAERVGEKTNKAAERNIWRKDKWR